MFSLEILIVLSYSVILAGKPAKKKQRRLAETVEKAKEKEKEEKAEKKKDKEKEKEKEKEKDKGKERDKAGVSAFGGGKIWGKFDRMPNLFSAAAIFLLSPKVANFSAEIRLGW